MFRLAINFTIQINEFDRALTTMPKIDAAVGNKNDRIILKYPIVKMAATKGNAMTVQMLVRGVMV